MYITINHRMRKVSLALGMFAMIGMSGACIGVAHAGTDYRTALRTCGDKWQAEKKEHPVAKGEGMAKWQAFRAECVRGEGWVPAREARRQASQKPAGASN